MKCLFRFFCVNIFESRKIPMRSSFEKGEGSFTNKNRQEIFCKYWSAGMKEPKALVFIAHGAGEHQLNYRDLADILKNQRLYVFSHDHQGHGRSAGPRMHIDDFRHYSRDVMQHCQRVSTQFPGVPVFMVGHSMGGAVVLLTALDHPNFFKGVVLIGPVVTAEDINVGRIRIAVAKLIARMCPNCPVLPRRNSCDISRDKEVVESHNKDPLGYHGWIKAKWGVSFLKYTSEMERRSREISTPFFVLHGDVDCIVSCKGSQHLYATAVSKDKTIKIVPGGYHQLHNEIEPVKTEILNDVKNWILKRI